MNIKTLRVQNFKNFEDKTFEFSEGFNLIIGDNGTGKTALLEAIALGISQYLDVITGRQYSFLQPKDVRHISFFKEHTFTLEPQNPASIEISVESAIIDSNGVYFSRLERNSSVATHTYSVGNLGQLGSFIAKSVHSGADITIPIICQYTTARTWFQGKGDVSLANTTINADSFNPQSRFESYSNVFDLNFSAKAWRDWLFRMELIQLQEGQIIKSYEAVKRAIQLCLEDCDLVHFDMRRNELVLRIKGNLMPFSLLSGGQSSVLAVVADIAYRMAQLNPHLLENVTLETPGVVLIDELDLLLHPKWQRKVVDNLREAFPKVQFFATTHSPFVIQSVRQGELIDLNETEGAAQFQNQSIEDIVEKVQGVDLPQLSERKHQMFDAATEYYKVLEKAQNANGTELEQLKTKLDQLLMPFSDNMAYHAFLEMERLAALGEKA